MNEENANEASQELLAQSGERMPQENDAYKVTKFAAFNEMDENHDGEVSEEEFVEVISFHLLTISC